jgi:hypothetical protein
MDPDQDLLEALDRREGFSGASVIAMIAGISIFAGAIGYFTLLSQKSGQELSTDGGALILIASAVGLLIAYRKFG